MKEEDTPRSIGFGSPRDDRFFTPRTMARSNSNSNSEEWQTPRYETPRYETPRYGSDGEFQTPRMFDADRKGNTSARSNGGIPAGYKQGESSIYRNSSQNKGVSYGRSEDNPYNQYRTPAESKTYRQPHESNLSGVKEEFNEHDDNEEYMTMIYEAGMTEKDVEDIFSYARHGRCDEIERLLNRGIPVDIRDDKGNTILIVACQNGNKRVAKAVLRRGANINGRNHKGNTPLHYCYQCEGYGFVKIWGNDLLDGYGETLGLYLVDKGADQEAKNHQGKTIWEGI